MASRTPLLPLVRKFFETDLVAAAHSLETMDENEAINVIKSLPPSLSAHVFPLLPVSYAATLLKEVSNDHLKIIIETMDPQQAAAIFIHLPQEIRETFVGYLSEKTKKQIQELLTYPLNSAGRFMSPDFVAFHTEVKVKEAIQKIRLLSRTKAPNSYVYVIDSEQHLVGILNMRDLILAPNEEKLENIMRKDVIAVNVFMDRAEVARLLSDHKYFAAPVVDNSNRLLGVVKSDRIIEAVQEEASEDILLMFGAGGDERTFSPFWFAVRKRLPWLYVNLGTAFLAAAVVGLFEDMIARITILAVYLPVVAGQGGNAGTQSLAVVMRGLVMHEIPRDKAWRCIAKETTVGLFNGIMTGGVTALLVSLVQGNAWLGLVIGLGMVVSLFAAGFSGALIPLLMKSLGFDPAQSSGIILTTITDVVGFFSFLGFAVLFQHHLI